MRATKRYRSNVMNWGMIPSTSRRAPVFDIGDYIYVPGIRAALDGDLSDIEGYVIEDSWSRGDRPLHQDMTENKREIVKAGCLINFNRNRTRG